jgi:hypothetical protein
MPEVEEYRNILRQYREHLEAGDAVQIELDIDLPISTEKDRLIRAGKLERMCLLLSTKTINVFDENNHVLAKRRVIYCRKR